MIGLTDLLPVLLLLPACAIPLSLQLQLPVMPRLFGSSPDAALQPTTDSVARGRHHLPLLLLQHRLLLPLVLLKRLLLQLMELLLTFSVVLHGGQRVPLDPPSPRSNFRATWALLLLWLLLLQLLLLLLLLCWWWLVMLLLLLPLLHKGPR